MKHSKKQSTFPSRTFGEFSYMTRRPQIRDAAMQLDILADICLLVNKLICFVLVHGLLADEIPAISL